MGHTPDRQSTGGLGRSYVLVLVIWVLVLLALYALQQSFA
jgi:hypothetical protein